MTAGTRIPQRYQPDTPVDQLHEHPDNPRRGDTAAIGASMAAHGFYGAVYAQQSTGRIVAGNHRYRVAVARGETSLPVVWLDVDDDQARRILLVDNRTGDLGGYDDDALRSVLQELHEFTDSGLFATGYSIEDLKELLGSDGGGEPNPYNPDPTSDDYYTPAWVFEALGLDFDLDVASPPVAPPWIPARRRYTIVDDGLAQPWEGRVWMNPPYSKPAPWVEKFLAHGHGVALLPATNSHWWRSIWRSGVAIAVHVDATIDFVGGAIQWPSFFVAAGEDCEAALGNLGPVRRLEPAEAA